MGFILKPEVSLLALFDYVLKDNNCGVMWDICMFVVISMFLLLRVAVLIGHFLI